MSEPVEFRCPNCGQLYRLSAEQLARRAGQTTNCRRCGEPFAFPALEGSEEQAPQAATQDTPAQEQPAPQPEPQAPAPAAETSAAVATATAPPELATAYPVAARRPSRRGPAFTWGGFLAFTSPITIPALRMLFWLGTILIVAAGLCMAGGAFYNVPAGSRVPFSVGWLALGAAWIVFGPIAWRVACEALALGVRILEMLKQNQSEPPENPE